MYLSVAVQVGKRHGSYGTRRWEWPSVGYELK